MLAAEIFGLPGPPRMRANSDTEPKAEIVQHELLRAKTPFERGKLTCSLTNAAIFHAKRAIERAHPELDQRERNLLFIEVHYGKALADQVRAYIRTALTNV